MDFKTFLLIFLGAEFRALVRVQPGWKMALLVCVSVSVKHYLYQYLPIAPLYATLLQLAALVSGVSCLASLVLSTGLVERWRLDPWYTGYKPLSLFGTLHERATLRVMEPLVVLVIAVLTMELLHLERVDLYFVWWEVFAPWWHYFGWFLPESDRAMAGWRWGGMVESKVRLAPMLMPGVIALCFIFDTEHYGVRRVRKERSEPNSMTFTTVEDMR